VRSNRILLAIVFCLAVGVARQAAAIPTDELLKSLKPSGDVNDFAGILSPAEKATLEARCRQLREKTGAQLAVVTLKSLEGGQIDDFANKLFAQWGIGQKDKKNGLLLIVAMEDRKFRIEVGYGLEPIIPDMLAGRILDHELRPRFRQAKFGEGLSAAVNALCELVERGEPADREALAAQANANDTPAIVVMFLTIFVLVGSLLMGIGFGSRTVALILFGPVFAGFPLAISAAAAWPWAPLVQVPLSLLTVGLGYYLARQSADMSRRGPRSPSGGQPRSTDWTWGGIGGTGGNWSSGGGGFSQDWGGFGGGSSGGGGASGGW